MSTDAATTIPPAEQLGTPSRRRSGMVRTRVAITIAVVLLLVGIGGGYAIGNLLHSGSSTTVLTETGSSLLYPLMKIWGPNYTAYNPSISVSPVSSGSGIGQSDAELGLVNIGASDGYVVNGSVTNIINVPVAISAQLIWYNLPGLTGHLNLNGTVLGMIYAQDITNWTNPWILNAQNASIRNELATRDANLPIYTVVRADSSGDTFLFTSLCYMSWSDFPFQPANGGLSGLAGSRVIPETGNAGMVQGVESQVGAIAYIGISYTRTVSGPNLNYAAVGDNASLSSLGGENTSNYVLPTAANISADATLGLQRLDFAQQQLAVSLILGGSWAGAVNLVRGGGGSNPTGNSTPYPITNLEYALIKTVPEGNIVTLSALRESVNFLQWAITFGNLPVYLSQVGFLPLTSEVAGLDTAELSSVQV